MSHALIASKIQLITAKVEQAARADRPSANGKRRRSLLCNRPEKRLQLKGKVRQIAFLKKLKHQSLSLRIESAMLLYYQLSKFQLSIRRHDK